MDPEKLSPHGLKPTRREPTGKEAFFNFAQSVRDEIEAVFASSYTLSLRDHVARRFEVVVHPRLTSAEIYDRGMRLMTVRLRGAPGSFSLACAVWADADPAFAAAATMVVSAVCRGALPCRVEGKLPTAQLSLKETSGDAATQKKPVLGRELNIVSLDFARPPHAGKKRDKAPNKDDRVASVTSLSSRRAAAKTPGSDSNSLLHPSVEAR